MSFPLAEKFKAPQGEGLWSGTQMAFVRLVGCSVGQTVCTACDTEFLQMHKELGGGKHDPDEIVEWAKPCEHICITGGEPLDRDIRPLLVAAGGLGFHSHIETSGTKHPTWLDPGAPRPQFRVDLEMHAIVREHASLLWVPIWLTVSPKPGYLESMIAVADEVKVILDGLGNGPGWPTVDDALRWADIGLLVYVQPRNERTEVDRRNLDAALEVVAKHPQLRLSCQLHKFIRTR